jgi:hypothetical protein
MEGFITNLIGTLGFSSVFLVIFFSIYYLYLKGNGEEIREDGKVKDKDKRLEKRILK